MSIAWWVIVGRRTTRLPRCGRTMPSSTSGSWSRRSREPDCRTWARRTASARNAHRAEVRRHEPDPLDLADSLLRHPAGSLLLDRRPLDRWRKDVDRAMAADRGPAHRAAAVPGPARAREAMRPARSSRQRYRGFVQDYKQRRLDDSTEPSDSRRPPRGTRRAYVREYLRWLRPYRYAALALLLLALLTTGLQMIEPLFMRFIIDRVLLNAGLDTASRLGRLQLAGAAFLAVIVLSNLVDALRDYRQRLLNVRVMMSLRRSLFERLLHLPLSKLWDMKTGGILSRLTGDVETTTGLLQMALVSPVVSLIRLAVAISVLLVLNWRLALTAMAIVPGAMLISFTAARRIRPIYRSMRKDVEHIDGRVGETFSGIRIVRAFRRELLELLNYMRGRDTVLRKELFAHRRELFLWTSWGLLQAGVNVVVIWYGGGPHDEGGGALWRPLRVSPGLVLIFFLVLR